MSKQRNMPWNEAADEVRYIQSVNPRNPGPGFNDDPACFARYREMQAAHAEESGHAQQANQMRMIRW